jgi:hypothetical protein
MGKASGVLITVLNTNVSNAAIQLTSNGIVPFTFAEPVTKLPLDMHLRHVEDVYMVTEYVDITTSMDTKMEILLENVNLHPLFVPIYFLIVKKSNNFSLITNPFLPSPFY